MYSATKIRAGSSAVRNITGPNAMTNNLLRRGPSGSEVDAALGTVFHCSQCKVQHRARAGASRSGVGLQIPHRTLFGTPQDAFASRSSPSDRFPAIPPLCGLALSQVPTLVIGTNTKILMTPFGRHFINFRRGFPILLENLSFKRTRTSLILAGISSKLARSVLHKCVP